jgi:hypothetical protein
MKYFIEIYCHEVDPNTGKKVWNWRQLKPTGGNPYTFKSRQEALDIVNMLYGGLYDEIKITSEA